jgi:hypothetical protein
MGTVRQHFCRSGAHGSTLPVPLLKSFVGEYVGAALTVSVGLRPDGVLTYSVPGQALYELRFARGLRFVAVGVVSTSIEFRLDGNGHVLGLISHQQNGDFFVKHS